MLMIVDTLLVLELSYKGYCGSSDPLVYPIRPSMRGIKSHGTY